ncbi:GtrA family protein [Streptomyces sp. NPDC046557]|uniref:GtrA family protein n=1 Tax=Streptomyces sp. NPDC046557 TaxID=3155372 RepID=UPI0033F9C3EE
MLPELARFTAAGLIAYLVELGVFNLCLEALHLHVAASSVAGAVAGTAVAYVGNRYWTYRECAAGSGGRRMALFCGVNLVGAGITTGCVVVSHDVLGMTGALADNAAKNVVGMGLAMAFRFWAYRTWVFSAPAGEPAEAATAAFPRAGGEEQTGLVGGTGALVGAADDLAGSSKGGWKPAFLIAVRPWLVAHLLVMAALGLARLRLGRLPDTGDVRPSAGTLVWDSGWYHALAERGYDSLGVESVRFFPLLPLLTRAGATVTHLPTVVVLEAACSMSALVMGVLLHVLVRREGGSAEVARRAVWLSQLAPGAAVLTLGYTEALGGVLAIAFFMLVRGGRGWWAVPVGLLSGLTRPTGVLLALPALVEALRPGTLTPRLRILAAALSPVVGTMFFLAWCRLDGHGWSAPYSVQLRPSLRGGLVGNPLGDYLHPTHGVLTRAAAFMLAVCLVELLAAVGLLWVSGRRLPASYTAWALALVVAAATASGFRSLPRYVTAAFPLMVAAAYVLSGRRYWRLAMGLCAAAFTVLAYLGFTGQVTP